MKWLRGGDDGARKAAVDILRGGGLVAIPTETVYGLAADARQLEAVRSIFSVKGRPLIDPLIVHFATLEQVEAVCEVSEEARILATHFWPGPLTLVLPRKANCPIPSLVSAGKPTLAVRIPGHPLLRKILLESQLPLAAPSANPFGYISPTSPEHVEESLGEKLDAILDGGPCEHGVESTILVLSPNGGVRLLRPGPISLGEVLRIPGIHEGADDGSADSETPEAPGMLKSHYRPSKGICLFSEGQPPDSLRDGDAVIRLQRPISPDARTFWLSEAGDEKEIAHNLFALLRQMDTSASVERVFVEMPNSEDGILRAVRDRLRRAAAPV